MRRATVPTATEGRQGERDGWHRVLHCHRPDVRPRVRSDDPDATASFFAGGWAHTGDLVVRDEDGRFTLRGRRKDMVRRGGENVAAAEVEQAMVTHPDVLECAVLAEPDEELGEEIRIVVVPVPGTSPDLRAFHAHLASQLAPFKVPRWWEVRDELPHTPSQRVAKHRLGPPANGLHDLATPTPP